jgi:hypothetical protein
MLPTRVIDVGNPGLVRLIVPNSTMGRYVCLSHCWGGHHPLKTTKENLSSHLHSIPPERIPKTYQDAAEFTRLMGIRYLWIDSLCIIQDSTEDWEQQSALMCSVYENCYVVIAATSAKDATEGFLKTKERGNFEIRGETTANVPYQILGLGVYPHPKNNYDAHHGPRWPLYQHEAQRWPLISRGWVFQERLLAPRVVHFTSDEILWECRECNVCQCGGFKVADREVWQNKTYFRRILEAGENDGLVAGWQALVENFSSLKLSRDTDKLPAISGLAKKMAQRRPGARYLAGLWDDSLELDLLWVNLDASLGDGHPMPVDWRAPSWSWASINSAVTFPLRQGTNTRFAGRTVIVEKYFTIHEAKSCPSTVDSTGQVESATLTITCCIFPASLEPIGKDSSGLTKWILSVDGTPDRFSSRGLSTPTHYLRLDNPSHVLDSYYEPGRLFFVRMARLRHWKSPNPGWPVDEREFSLVVYCPDPSVAEYRRIGMLMQERHVEGNHEWVRTWLECPSCFETGGVQQTIRIV